MKLKNNKMNIQKEKTKSQNEKAILQAQKLTSNKRSGSSGTPQTEKEIIHIGNDNRCQTCYEAGKSEVLSGEYCVKLIEQGKEIGKAEQKAKTKEIIEKLFPNEESKYYGIKLDYDKFKQLLQEIEK